jgi:CheY-like chemotaxis protein
LPIAIFAAVLAIDVSAFGDPFFAEPDVTFGGGVPVIAMSAIFSSADRLRILAAGFQACLAKPFTADQLMQALLSVLEN